MLTREQLINFLMGQVLRQYPTYSPKIVRDILETKITPILSKEPKQDGDP